MSKTAHFSDVRYSLQHLINKEMRKLKPNWLFCEIPEQLMPYSKLNCMIFEVKLFIDL